ncbi:MAG: hypothetical protein O2905_06720 [Proteobacteria bacterium]|nr:hypothetical protein [Pseudomonadota bacterium]MDA1132900.1 hypothetical protein [Pseudomonadota bacterium]
MVLKSLRIGVFGPVLFLVGCSFTSESLWPSFGFGDDEETVMAAETAPPAAPAAMPDLAPAPPPQLGQTNFAPPAVTRAVSTGTFVGQKVAQHRAELISLQGTIVQRNQQLQSSRQQTTEDSQRYHGTIAAINTRLQLGTTPGNPVLTAQWQSAQQELERLSGDVAQLNSLANSVAADSAMAAYLLEAARATYGLAGAIDEDHRQLAILEDETNRTVVLIDRLLNELSEDISRQTSYIGNERRNLNVIGLAIQNGEILGNSLFNRAFANAAPVGGGIATPAAAAGLPAGQQPLVVIRFDRPNVQYEQPLFNAISAAIERRPQASFDLVAVAATGGTAAEAALNLSRAKQNADEVVRALANMGLPADRLRLSSTSSGDTATNEVRIYVR